ncbi:MAG: sulfatase, partial [Planctomycetota bacterium]
PHPRGERAAVVLAAAALALPTLLAGRGVPHRPPPPAAARAPELAPSIVLVIVDTLRADHAFAAPGEPPRTFDRLAAAGVRFDQAIAASPWTLPSVASLLTSAHPSRHGAVTRRHPLPAGAETLAEVLHAEGWETAAFTGGAFLAPDFGLDQGFEIFDAGAEYHFVPFRGHVPFVWRLIRNRYYPLRFAVRRLGDYGGLPLLAARLERWLAGRDRTRPFFLLVHTYQVHDYYLYQPAPDDSLRAERGGQPAPLGNRLTIHPYELQGFPPEVVEWFHAVYRRRIAHVDRELGALLDRVAGEAGPGGLVTILTSDHGEGFDPARGRIHHGSRLHDDLLRVPLVVGAPGRLPAGHVVAEQVSGVDLMPTVLELAGLPVPAGLAGRSLLRLLAGEADAPRPAWSEVHLGPRRRVSLRLPPGKIVETPEGVRAFRLDLDPPEDEPLPPPLPAPLTALWAERETILAPRSAAERDLGGAVRDQLRRIGY